MFTIKVYSSFDEVRIALQKGMLKIGGRIYFAIKSQHVLEEVEIVEDKGNNTFALKSLGY